MPLSTTPSDQSLAKKSLWYAAAAGAVAGLAAPTAQAQIVYTDVDPDLEVQDTFVGQKLTQDSGVVIDLDGDGDSEIYFGERVDASYTIAVFNDEDGAGADGDIVSAIVGNIIPFGESNFAYFLPLEAGSTISSFGATVTGYGAATFTFGGSDPNGFIGAGDVYIGFQFDLEEGTQHFAWIRVEMPEAGLLIIKDYAFQSQPLTPLAAGEGMGTSNEDAAPLAGSHRLSAAYPNPFNTDARFNLEVARTQDVTIELFDVLGRSVQVLHDGALTAGTDHEFAIRGAELPNGVYLVRAVGEEFKETRTVTLAR